MATKAKRLKRRLARIRLKRHDAGQHKVRGQQQFPKGGGR